MKEQNLKESYGTLSETINALVKLGYTHDFNIKGECLVCHQTHIELSPEEFQIDKVYRFEGASDPEYQSILYVISSEKYNVKGSLVNGYGINSNEMASKLVEKLNTNQTNNAMENKSNEATPLRPEGERVLNAPLVEMDLNKFIEQVKSETVWADSDRNSITIYKSETVRIVLIGLRNNAELKPHQANGVISVQVLEGKLNFSTAQESISIEKGQMIALQENITHSVRALTDSFFLLTLSMNKN